jgi:hypothetical protein
MLLNAESASYSNKSVQSSPNKIDSNVEMDFYTPDIGKKSNEESNKDIIISNVESANNKYENMSVGPSSLPSYDNGDIEMEY